jgi:hypothetical protein
LNNIIDGWELSVFETIGPAVASDRPPLQFKTKMEGLGSRPGSDNKVKKRNLCEAVCPKEIKLDVIARMNRDYLKASWTTRGNTVG